MPELFLHSDGVEEMGLSVCLSDGDQPIHILDEGT